MILINTNKKKELRWQCMPKFWGYVSNEEYAIGCTSTTVYVYDKEGK